MAVTRKTATPTVPALFEISPLKATIFLFLVTLVLFRDFLSLHTNLVLSRDGEDLTSQFVWWRQFGFSELQKGHLALWNPHLFCGAPFFGGFQSALLYPPNWLFMVLPLPFAVNATIALHVFLAGWFTFLWVRQRGSHPASALMAAFGFMMGASYILHIVPGHLSNLCTMAWIPLILMAVDGYRKEGKLRWILWGMVGLALQVFSGHIQYVYYTVVFIAFYALFGLRGSQKKVPFLLGLLAMGIGAALLSAVQLFTGWDAALESVRAQHLSIDVVDIADITPERLWGLLLPGFFGGWQNYWGGGMYPEGAVFISVTAFVLALFGLKLSSHPQKWLFAGLALLFALVAIGKRGPLFVLFCKYFPLFGNFRGIGKLNILITLCLVVLAALGMDEIFKDPKSLKGLAWSAGIGCGTLSTLAFLFWVAPRVGGMWLFKQFASHAGQMAASLLACGALLGLLTFLSVVAQKRPVFRYGFLVLSFLELFLFAKDNLPYFDYQALKDKVAIIQKTYDEDPGDYRVLANSKNYTLGTSGLDIWGEDPVILSRYARFVEATRHSNLDTNTAQETFHDISPALGLLRLRYCFKDAGDHLTVEKTGLREEPRAFLAGRFEVLPEEDALQKAAEGKFDPQKEVLLESSPGFSESAGVPGGRVTLKDLSSDEIDIQAEAARPTLLVITDNYSSGWKIHSPQGGETNYKILVANGFQMAIPITEGSHHFVMEYRPDAFVLGKGVSLFAWLVLFGLLMSRIMAFIKTTMGKINL